MYNLCSKYRVCEVTREGYEEEKEKEVDGSMGYQDESIMVSFLTMMERKLEAGAVLLIGAMMN